MLLAIYRDHLTHSRESIEWTVTPMLPDGIHLDNEGVVRGNATTTFDWSQYTITASNSQGSSQGIILIRVTDVAPTSIGYPESNLLLRVGVPMTGMSPTTLSVVDYWSIEPNLPPGISINSLTGEISGTPASVSDLREYTVTASNSGGSTSATIYIEVKIPPPSAYRVRSRYYWSIPDFQPLPTGPTTNRESTASPGWFAIPPMNDRRHLQNDTPDIPLYGRTIRGLRCNEYGQSSTSTRSVDLSYGIGSIDTPDMLIDTSSGPCPFPIRWPDDFPVISGSHVDVVR